MTPSRATLGPLAGWLALAVAAVLGVGGAAAHPEGMLLGAPRVLAVAAAALALAGLVALAGFRTGTLAMGLVPLVAAVLLGLPPRLIGAWTGPPLLALAAGAAAALLAGARPPWSRAALAPVLAAVFALGAARAQQQVGPQGDEPHYLMVADSLLRDHDVALSRDYEEQRYRAFFAGRLDPHYRVRGREGEIYSLHALGLSVLILPAYALAGYPGASFFMAALGVWLALEIRGLVRDWTGDDALAEGVGWIVGLSAPLVHYAGLVFTEVPAALLLTLALRRAHRTVSAKDAWVGGLALALLPWLNVRYAILAAVVLAGALAARPAVRTAAAWTAPLLLSAAAIAFYHSSLYGFLDPRRVYGRRPEFSAGVVPVGLPGLFLDQEFGLLVYAPVFALAVPGVVVLARRRPREGAMAICLVLAVVAVASSWPMWRGGFNPPARFLLPVLPVLAAAAASWLARGLSAPGAMLVGWGLWIGIAGTLDRSLVHRDRDGTAPLFRALSGAEEWTRLLPGFVLDESAADRAGLALLWTAVLAAAAAARRKPTPVSIAVTTAVLVAATALATRLATLKTEGRDAVRVVGRPALQVPGGGLTAAAKGEWGTSALSWGPLYEPHRHPAGAVVGGRLRLPQGAYDLEIAADIIPGAGEAPSLEVRPEGNASSRSERLSMAKGRLQGGFEVGPGEGPVTLSVRGGGPFLLKGLVLSPSTFRRDHGLIRQEGSRPSPLTGGEPR